MTAGASPSSLWPRLPRPERRSVMQAWRGGFWGPSARHDIAVIRWGLDHDGYDLPDGARVVVERLLDVYVAVIDAIEEGPSRTYHLPHRVHDHQFVSGRWLVSDLDDQLASLDLQVLLAKRIVGSRGLSHEPHQLAEMLYLESSNADRNYARPTGVTLCAIELAAALKRRYPPQQVPSED